MQLWLTGSPKLNCIQFKVCNAFLTAFVESEDTEVLKTFKKLADSLSEDFRFAFTLESSLAEKHGYNNDIVIFQPQRLANKFEDGALKYDGDMVLHKVKSWLNDNMWVDL